MLTNHRFFDTDELSDITIKFSGREVRCHRIILCAASDYFKKLCGVGSRFRERGEKEIELKDDDDPDAVEAMLAYIYSFEYAEQFSARIDKAVFHLNVYVTAKKYLIDKLANKALVCLRVAIIELNDDEEAAWSFIKQHANYRDQHEGIDAMVDELKEHHLQYLMMRPELHAVLPNDPKIKQLVRDKFEAAKLTEHLHKLTMVTCCSSVYFPVQNFQIGVLRCPQCYNMLLVNGRHTLSARYEEVWI